MYWKQEPIAVRAEGDRSAKEPHQSVRRRELAFVPDVDWRRPSTRTPHSPSVPHTPWPRISDTDTLPA